MLGVAYDDHIDKFFCLKMTNEEKNREDKMYQKKKTFIAIFNHRFVMTSTNNNSTAVTTKYNASVNFSCVLHFAISFTLSLIQLIIISPNVANSCKRFVLSESHNRNIIVSKCDD